MNQTNDPLKAYKNRQAHVQKLLAQIQTALEQHDRKASANREGHIWAHVGEMAYVEESLQEIKAFLFNEE